MELIKLKFFAMFLIFYFILYLNFPKSEKHKSSNNKEKHNTYTSTYKSAEVEINQRCNPIFENSSQQYTIIDGVQYPKSIPLYLNKSINFECLNKNKIKRILYWVDFYRLIKAKILKLGVKTPLKIQNCPVTNCELTNDRARLNESDLVLVHMWEGNLDPPTYRPPNQRWVFLMYESPIRTHKNLSVWNNVFNLTSTYRIDSDFPGFYESNANFYWKENTKFNETFNFYGNKTKFAAAVSIFFSNFRLRNLKNFIYYMKDN